MTAPDDRGEEWLFMKNATKDVPAPKRRRSPEHAFQAWVDRLIDRIVLSPMFVTGIDHASQSTDNARARMAGRGIKFGLPDVFLSQYNQARMCRLSMWIELKRGSGLSPAQIAVHQTMKTSGQYVAVCSTMAQVVTAIRNYGFDIHPNADELAREYEMRVAASEAAPAKPRTPGKIRVRVAPSRTRRWAKIQQGMR